MDNTMEIQSTDKHTVANFTEVVSIVVREISWTNNG